MIGRSLSTKFSICRMEYQDESSEDFSYVTVRWGYDTEDKAIQALRRVAEDEGLALSDLAVVGAVFAHDLELDG